VVEGTVATFGEGGGRIYLNFAKDWHSDFTISVDRKDAPAFAAAGVDLKALAGKRLRVRGFLGWRNGPMIEASHPEQIELLPDASKQDMPPPGQRRRLSRYRPSSAIVYPPRSALGQRGVSDQRHAVLYPRLSGRLDDA